DPDLDLLSRLRVAVSIVRRSRKRSVLYPGREPPDRGGADPKVRRDRPGVFGDVLDRDLRERAAVAEARRTGGRAEIPREQRAGPGVVLVAAIAGDENRARAGLLRSDRPPVQVQVLDARGPRHR